MSPFHPYSPITAFVIFSFFSFCILECSIIFSDLVDQVVGQYFYFFILQVVDFVQRLGNSLISNFHSQITVIHNFIEIDLEIDCYRQSNFVTSIKIPGGGISLLISGHTVLLDILRLLLCGHLDCLMEHITYVHVYCRFLFGSCCIC